MSLANFSCTNLFWLEKDLRLNELFGLLLTTNFTNYIMKLWELI
jgi:hypothetical protein